LSVGFQTELGSHMTDGFQSIIGSYLGYGVNRLYDSHRTMDFTLPMTRSTVLGFTSNRLVFLVWVSRTA